MFQTFLAALMDIKRKMYLIFFIDLSNSNNDGTQLRTFVITDTFYRIIRFQRFLPLHVPASLTANIYEFMILHDRERFSFFLHTHLRKIFRNYCWNHWNVFLLWIVFISTKNFIANRGIFYFYFLYLQSKRRQRIEHTETFWV